MNPRSCMLTAALALSLAMVTPAFGQSVLQVSAAYGGAVSDVAPSGSVAIKAGGPGQPVLVNVTARYTGTATAIITGIGITGTTEMVVSSATALPATLTPNGSVSFTVQYLPVTANAVTGQISIAFTESSQPSSFRFVLAGTAPNLSFSYFLAPAGAHTDLRAGDRITFPATNAGTSLTATITVLNRGTAAGSLESVNLAGAGYQLAGSPAPVQLQPGQQASFEVTFAPQSTGGSQGALTLGLGTLTVTFALAGTGTAPNLTMAYTLSDGNQHSLAEGALVNFPSVDINTTTTATFRIVNQGTGPGTVSSVAFAGAAFRLTALPLLPASVAPGETLQFGIVFAPTQIGSFTGTFRIDLAGRSVSGGLLGSTNTPTFAVAYNLSDGVVHPVSEGAAIQFPAVDINATATAAFGIINQGAGSGTVTGITLAGNGFRLSGVPLLPATVRPGEALTFGIVFAPTQSGTYIGSFRIDLPGRSITGSVAGSTTAPGITLSYVDPSTSNILPLQHGSALSLPNTPAGAVSSVVLIAGNTGAGTGFLNAVSLGGNQPSAFQLLSLPALPAAVPPSQQVRFGVQFKPQQQQAFSAALLIDLNGQTVLINLQGQGTGPQFTYTWSTGGVSAAVFPGGTLAIGDTAVGKTSRIDISILNAGTADGQIPSIAVTGPGLSLAELPLLPLNLRPAGSQQFALSFTPQTPGVVNGRLSIGADTFIVSGTGIGSQLTYKYENTAAVTPVGEGGTVVFPPVAVGSNREADFTVQNTGTSPATIFTINIAAPSPVFTLQNVPSMPFNLDPGAAVTFRMAFAPNTTGTLAASLRVNTGSFTLSGTGTQPASIPDVAFQVPAGTPKPGQQMSVGFSLSSAYPLPLKGTLNLTFVPKAFTDDPAVQFASGGRTVNFTIPAGSTQALFNGSSAAIPIQTGTTAGEIVMTPSFATQGDFDLTPASPPTHTIAIPIAAPSLLSAGITSQTLNTFVVSITGYSTSRAVQRLEIEVSPRAGENFPTTHLSVDVDSASAAWFQSSASHLYGGTFTVAIPFVMQNGSTTDDLVRRIQSLAVTAVNEAGSSNAIAVTIQ